MEKHQGCIRNKFDFMPAIWTTKAIYLLRQLIERKFE